MTYRNAVNWHRDCTVCSDSCLWLRRGGAIQPQCIVKNEELEWLAMEIRDYLDAHPNAADSLEGVAKWWLRRQRYEQALEKVRNALDYLVQQGLVTKTSAIEPVYSLTNTDAVRDDVTNS